jgi:uncharacterized integral membrane protein
MQGKIILLIVLIVLLTVFILQNTYVVTINALFWTFEMSAIVLISFTGLLGVITGFILAKVFGSSHKKF